MGPGRLAGGASAPAQRAGQLPQRRRSYTLLPGSGYIRASLAHRTRARAIHTYRDRSPVVHKCHLPYLKIPDLCEAAKSSDVVEMMELVNQRSIKGEKVIAVSLVHAAPHPVIFESGALLTRHLWHGDD